VSANLFHLPDEIEALLKLIAENRRRLETDMNVGLAAKGGPNPVHIGALKELATAMSTLGKEARQWAGHQKSNLDKMSPAQKARVVVQFILNELPLGARRDLYLVLAKNEAERPDGLNLTVVDRFNNKTSTTPSQADE
jgi:hypothetical protein